MRTANGLIMRIAEQHRLPAGGALAVDRDPFAQSVTTALQAHPNISIVDSEHKDLPASGSGSLPPGR